MLLSVALLLTLGGCPRSAEVVAGVRATRIERGTFSQPIRDGAGTFDQRYLFTTEFARGSSSPVLFYLCGEWTCGDRDVQNLADVAKALGAVIVALEHRYYGSSRPYADDSEGHLHALTIANALEDAADFQRSMQASRTLSTGQWIVVGGSYAGSLAAFYREEHPDLVVGAWAESASVHLQLTYTCADTTVATVLGPECAERLVQAVGASESAWLRLTAGGAEAPPSEDARREHLAGTFFALRPPSRAACASLGTTTVPTRSASSSAAARDWDWQACTEYGGFWAHARNGPSVVPADIDEEYTRARCLRTFGAAPRVAEVDERYYPGFRDGRVGNVFFVNGIEDPARCNSIHESAGSLIALDVPGGHWPSLHALRVDDAPEVWAVHREFVRLAQGWLAAAR